MPTRQPLQTPPRVAVRAVLAALLLGALLNGPGLVSAATGLPVGPVRAVALAVAGGLERAGAALALDRPRVWLIGLREGTAPQDAGRAVGAGAPPAPTGDPHAAASGAGTPSASLADRFDEQLAQRRTGSSERSRPISAEDPLRVLLAGDSLIGAIAEGYGRAVAGRDEVWWHQEVRISTGLARPDVLDWHAHLEGLLATHDPDVVVLMLGGNDDQSLVVPGGTPIHYGEPGWEPEYEQRVARLLDVAGADARQVIWLQLPAMRPDRLEASRQLTNAAAHRAAVDRDVQVLDTGAVLSPEGYTTRVDGTAVRAEDGVHLTHPGGDLVAAELEELVARRWGHGASAESAPPRPRR